MKHVRTDALHGYAHGTWKSIGSPDTLSAEEYRIVAANMEPVMIEEKRIEQMNFDLLLPPSSVSMIIISDNTSADVFPEPQISRILDYNGLNGEKKKFVQWEQVKDQIVRYNVLASFDGEPFHVVNPNPLFDIGYLHVLPDGVEFVDYRIEVVP
jgi:hypothetical protein